MEKPKDLIDTLDQVLIAKGWPTIILTEIKREPKDQEAYYWDQVAKDFKCTEEIARSIARKKFSWHLVYCAVDFSAKIYDQEQKKFILSYLKKDRPGPTWEILLHNVGLGSHFHVAYEDQLWKQKWLNLPQG